MIRVAFMTLSLEQRAAKKAAFEFLMHALKSADCAQNAACAAASRTLSLSIFSQCYNEPSGNCEEPHSTVITLTICWCGRNDVYVIDSFMCVSESDRRSANRSKWVMMFFCGWDRDVWSLCVMGESAEFELLAQHDMCTLVNEKGWNIGLLLSNVSGLW